MVAGQSILVDPSSEVDIRYWSTEQTGRLSLTALMDYVSAIILLTKAPKIQLER